MAYNLKTKINEYTLTSVFFDESDEIVAIARFAIVPKKFPVSDMFCFSLTQTGEKNKERTKLRIKRERRKKTRPATRPT